MLDDSIRSGVDPDTHPIIYRSKTPKNVDGYRQNTPKILRCPHTECSGWAFLDEDPETPGWQDPEFHDDDDCPYRTD